MTMQPERICHHARAPVVDRSAFLDMEEPMAQALELLGAAGLLLEQFEEQRQLRSFIGTVLMFAERQLAEAQRIWAEAR